MSRSEAVVLVQKLDAIEVDVRRLEHRIQNIRMSLVERHRLTGAERGYVEGEDAALREVTR